VLEKEISAYVSDGNEYSLDGIASSMGVPSFLLQVSIDAMCPHTLSCRVSDGKKMYTARTVKSRMLPLDQKVDDMHAQREPGHRPTDPTAIIKPRDEASLLMPGVEENIRWTFEVPPGMEDLKPWILEGLGWEMDPFVPGLTMSPDGSEKPVTSPIRWMGGKSKMLEWLIQRFPEHYAYVEVFGGSLKPLFAKKRAKVEVVNDFYDSLINFWRVMSQWPEELADAINALPSSRVYQRWFQREHAHRNLFERAVMFGYLSLHSYNGLVWKPFAGSAHQPPGRSDAGLFKQAASRLDGVYIECQDFRETLERYSVKKVAAGPVFTYLDPPYLATEGYALKFPEEWHQEIAEWMVKIHEAGNLVLMTNSFAAGEAYPRWFGSAKHNFHVTHVDVDYTLGHAESRGARQEAVISNFRLEQTQGKLF